METTTRRTINHRLAFLALVSFLLTFIGSRVFTTLASHTVVVSSGIHFHHFWYGLGMIAVAGWLGIISTHPTHRRIYAIVFGLGGGLVGDEVGLLLTFGNYYSYLTYVFGVGLVGVLAIALLLFYYRERLEADLVKIGRGERLAYLGIVVAGFSALAFSVEYYLFGSLTLLCGALIASIGYWHHRRRSRHSKYI